MSKKRNKAYRLSYLGMNWSEMDLRFIQCFGERKVGETVQEGDVISSVKFDESGDRIMIGDQAGRLVFLRADGCGYAYHAELGAHERGMDYLQGRQISARVVDACWVPRKRRPTVLSATEKVIKLWEVPQSSDDARKRACFARMRDGFPRSHHSTTNDRQWPLRKSCRATYDRAHLRYTVHSVSSNSEGELFLSSDDLRVNVWHLERTDRVWRVLDTRPKSLEHLEETVTKAAFDPGAAQMWGYATSKGRVCVCDLRVSSNSDAVFSGQSASTCANPEYDEAVRCIGALCFARGGHVVTARDYVSATAWDLRRGDAPVHVWRLESYTPSQLDELYYSDKMFESFGCSVSDDGSKLVTGTYGNCFRTMDGDQGFSLYSASKRLYMVPVRACGRLPPYCPVRHVNWHAGRGVCAVASLNSLYLYEEI